MTLYLAALLIGLGIPYADYAADMGTYTLLLTPAIIALAVPLYQNLQKAQENLHTLVIAILVGGQSDHTRRAGAGSIGWP